MASAIAACAVVPTSHQIGAPAETVSVNRIDDTSFTDEAGVRTIQLSVTIPAAQESVFAALTSAEGWKTWAVPNAFGAPSQGGRLETSYDRDAKPGDPGNIVQEFLVVLPPRLVVFRTIKTPKGFPHAELYYRTYAVFELSRDGATRTRLTFSHTGFGVEPGFDDLFAFFKQGDAQTLEQLRRRFESGPIDFSKER